MPSIRPSRCSSSSRDGVGHLRIAEERGDELGGAVRLVAAGEAAREHQTICALVELPCTSASTALGHVGGRQVVDDQNHPASPPARSNGAGRVVLAVGAREHRDDDARLGECARSGSRALCSRASYPASGRLAGLGGAVDRPAPARPPTLPAAIGDTSDGLAAMTALPSRVVHSGHAEELPCEVLGQLHDERAVGVLEQVAQVRRLASAASRCRCRRHILNSASASTADSRAWQAAATLPLVDQRSTSVEADQERALGQAVLVVLPAQDDRRVLPAALNSGDDDVCRPLPVAIAKETSVGGTSRSSKLPDIESLPPMARDAQAHLGHQARPAAAADGLPQRSGSSRSFSKYSWKRQVDVLAVAAGGDQLGNDSRPRPDRRRGKGSVSDQIGVEAPCHAGAGGASRRQHGKLGRPWPCVGVSWYLPPKGISTVRRADGGVEPLRPGPCWSRRSGR